MDYDVIIIGGGAAGLSAALWCDDLALSALLLEADDEFGGQLLWTYNEIKNHLGLEAADGRELRDRFVRQTEKRRFERRLRSKVAGIDIEKKLVVLAGGVSFSAPAIVIATGVRRKSLGVEGEEKFQKKGIIRSGKLDAAQAEGKTALVVGGGDAAFENALILAETAAGVTLVHRGETFRARDEFTERARKHPKIKILPETRVLEIRGGAAVEAVRLENSRTGEPVDLSCEIVLVRIGVEPNTDFVRGKLETDKRGYLKIDRNCQTSAPGIFAAGDVANPLAPTVSSAVGMGATAVKTIQNAKLKMQN